MVFLKPPTTARLRTYQPTTDPIINFKHIFDEKMRGHIINTILRMWVIVFWLMQECVIEKVKIKVNKYKTYHTEIAFE